MLTTTLFFACSAKKKETTRAEKGVIDFSKSNFETHSAIALNGEWEFYWKQYLIGKDFEQASPSYVEVPNSWDSYKTISGEVPTTEGYTTYRLRVKIPSVFRGNELLALKLEFITTNYALFIDNKPMNQPKKLGTSPETTDGHYDPEIYFFIPQKDTVEIVFFVANYAYRLGGLTQTISLGKAQPISTERERTILINFFSIGVLVIMGLAHLILFFFRRRTWAILYFASYCFIIALRAFFTDDYYFTDIFPNADFEVGNKLSYLTFSIGMPMFAMFVKSLYSEDFSSYVIKVLLFFSAIFSLLVLFTRGIVYSNYLIYYQLIAFLLILYALYFTIRILIKRREGSVIFAFGMATIIVAATNDILVANVVIDSINLMPIGSFIFIFSHTLLLSKNLASAYKKEETFSKELLQTNQMLEAKVKERTSSLQDIQTKLFENLEELKSKINTVNVQNKEIKAQNLYITSSINYAKTIQYNILSDFKVIQSHFPDSFLVFKPKDIVSGDFYYFNQKGDKIFLAAVDCTGHGVPGAFMSLIGYKILNEIIDVQQVFTPSEILRNLHLGIKEIFNQEANTHRNGMDIALVMLDKGNSTLTFAGAKAPLVYIKNGKMNMIEGENFYIGGNSSKSEVNFSQSTIFFSANDQFSFYLFSDGYQDQFGGEENKKLMKKHFRELLFQLKDFPMKEQGNLLQEWHEAWKGNLAQTDDILVMGFRLY
ncbi:PP2C family protein-serine/threonine phosphatase [Thermoflexibacter ruber]|uniref:PP2C family protein-serine/threonine phosphatase n=1 Tax=Thermoflexibacter ruber TaxID=1003 RepID=UPI0015A566A0|nr:7TM diverse intracellular signaling domain-containing protein [Thermoflexibacter ruber]